MEICINSHVLVPTSMNYTPFKKVTQYKFDRLYLFNHGFVFVMLDITGKPVYLPSYWCLICYDCFAGACAEWINWGQCQKWKVAKFDPSLRRWSRWYFTVLSRLCPNSHAYSCLYTEFHRNKTSCWFSNSGAILQHLIFGIAPKWFNHPRARCSEVIKTNIT